MSEIDNIHGNVVSLHSDTEFLELSLCLLQGMSDKDDDSLSLALVLPMLQAQLSNLDGIEEISFTVYMQFLVNNHYRMAY